MLRLAISGTSWPQTENSRPKDSGERGGRGWGTLQGSKYAHSGSIQDLSLGSPEKRHSFQPKGERRNSAGVSPQKRF